MKTPPSSWKQQGAICATHDDPDLWHSELNERRTRVAKSLCAQCPLQEQCLDHALEKNFRYGVWGGLTSDERKRFVRRYLSA